MKTHNKLAILCLLGALILSACAPTAANPTQAPAVENTTSMEILKTQAMQTARAELTLEALNNPTSTPLPTEVPPTNTPEAPVATLEQPTAAPVQPTVAPVLPTATLIPVTAVPTAIPTRSDFTCSVTESSPKSGQVLPLGGDFDGRWTFKNTGTRTWETSEVDFVYVSGTKFQADVDSIDLPKQVKPGESVEIIIDMYAPKDAGNYQATWSFKQGSISFCAVSILITTK